ncbi:MAG TPA: heparan-alpha-glucosaminide N-acetyltransferase domain-containing protein, partial [Thermoanaerobaculia bacterium]|nr:heparan-alpha-glucosaminide N-acetyltransferase domain-containing protein [Thermoanaerobaculia bacterium]
DTIFPFFLFIVGVSMALSFGRRRAMGSAPGALYGHVVRRAAVLVGLGLLLNVTSAVAFHAAHVRFPGVLQRIGLCVLVAGSVFVAGGIRASALAAGVLLAGYAWLLGAGPLDPETNVAARVDRLVFGVHTWKPGWDPEGLLSTLPAIATTLLGAVAGERVRTLGRPRRAAAELAAVGVAAFTAGLLWGRILPINKNLWTSSYALAMSGLAAVALALAIEIVDERGWRRWAAPFVWLGRNAIAIFTLSVLGAIVLIAIRVPGPGGTSRSVWSAIYRTVFDRFADPRFGSLLFALAYLAVWILVGGVLYRRRIFLRI